MASKISLKAALETLSWEKTSEELQGKLLSLSLKTSGKAFQKEFCGFFMDDVTIYVLP